MKRLITTAIVLFSAVNLYSAVPVGIMPIEGDGSSADIEAKIKDAFIKSDGITVVADKMMNKIVKMHEKAQTVGSSYHDISKLKVAAYIITGEMAGNKLTLKAVDVNEGTEVYSTTIELSKDSSQNQIKRKVKEISEQILMQAASKTGDEIPSEAVPYMKVVNNLVSSLGNGDQASYKYLAVYTGGAYRHPDPENKKSADIAKLTLNVMRQSLNRAKVTFISMKNEKGWIYINTVADKTGQKTKVKFGIIELDDGSLAVGTCEEGK